MNSARLMVPLPLVEARMLPEPVPPMSTNAGPLLAVAVVETVTLVAPAVT